MNTNNANNSVGDAGALARGNANNANYGTATAFLQSLTATNLLAQTHHFVFCRVNGMADFQDLLARSTSSTAFVCVTEITDGYIELNNTPRTRRVRSVFFAMRYPIDDLAQRAAAMAVLRELFRQFMSVLILEQTRLQQNNTYLDPRIRFTELPEYFATGCACARFEIATDHFTDLRYNPAEWTTNP